MVPYNMTKSYEKNVYDAKTSYCVKGKSKLICTRKLPRNLMLELVARSERMNEYSAEKLPKYTSLWLRFL